MLSSEATIAVGTEPDSFGDLNALEEFKIATGAEAFKIAKKLEAELKKNGPEAFWKLWDKYKAGADKSKSRKKKAK